MTYNLRGLRHGVDRVAEAIASCAPDVVLVQESGPRRSFRRLASRLAMQCGSDPRVPFRRRIQNAVLVRPPLSLTSTRLHRFSHLEPWYPRGALVSAIEGPRVRLTAVSVHLGVRPADRRRHGVELLGLVRSLPPPLVLGGDFNEGPDGAAASRTRTALLDAWTAAGAGVGATFSSSDRRARIDHVYVSAEIEPNACRVPSGPRVARASDHLPVVADVSVPDPGA
jgi:endonuclease/exonuclease/phosphatase family metal-dependent hydrolase